MISIIKWPFILLVILGFEFTGRCLAFDVDKCGYKSCMNYDDPTVINVHIVPHSHNDVAWTKTFDRYYNEDVQSILDSVIKELWNDSRRKFIYVETAFFWRWWKSQSSEVRARVQTMVHLGQLHFAGGAWSMNDEATTHYQSIIDQFTYGLSKLDEAFGQCGRPLVGWQIDPFGHSREFASLLAAMGYDALFIDRIDYQDKDRRLKKKKMEMIWRGDDTLGESSDIFTSILYEGYTPPRQFCFETRMYCSDEKHYLNYKEKLEEVFVEYAKEQARFYRTNNVLIPMGGDFHYRQANVWFGSLDQIIQELNSRPELKVKVYYSTPHCYYKAVKDANIHLMDLPTKTDDFFPYVNEPNTYWTGFYTSRPSLKFFEREANRYFQMVKQLQVLAQLDDKNLEILEEFKSAMGLMQHHDSITGTQQDHVARDLRKILDRALEDSLLIANQAFNKMLNIKPALDFERCQLNESMCLISEQSEQFIVLLYNPLAWEVLEPIRIPVMIESYQVYEPNGQSLETQLINIPEEIRNATRKTKATHEVCFLAKLRALSFSTFYIIKLSETLKENYYNMKKNTTGDGTYLENKYLKIGIKEKARISNIILQDGSEIKFSLQYSFYRLRKSSPEKISGAYVFSSGSLLNISLNFTTLNKGPIIQEIRYAAKDVHSTTRLYKDLNFIEIDWLIGPINVTYVNGKQYIIRYITDLENEGIFYTDSNGRQMIKRKLNERETYEVVLEDEIAGNYYPIVNKVYIRNDTVRFAVLTDRAEGGTSLSDGEIEIMLHRRLLTDDGWGVEEALNETEDGIGLVVRGRHRIFISQVGNSTQHVEEKRQVIQYHLKPIVLVANASDLSLETWLNSRKTSSWATRVPEGIHLLTLEPLGNRMLLLRLENYLEEGDKIDTTVQVDLKKIFNGLTLYGFKETLLGGNVEIKRKKRHVNNFENGTRFDSRLPFFVKIKARQIRTFIVDYY